MMTRRSFFKNGVAVFTVSFAAPAFLSDLAKAQGSASRNPGDQSRHSRSMIHGAIQPAPGNWNSAMYQLRRSCRGSRSRRKNVAGWGSARVAARTTRSGAAAQTP